MELPKSTLQKLCNGNYDEQLVKELIFYFVKQFKKLLLYRQKGTYSFTREWEDSTQELDDMAIDFVAEIFVRNEMGEFVILQSFFEGKWGYSEQQFQDEIHRLVTSVCNQHSVALFKIRDPFGRIFYRSLYYILSKHDNWDFVFFGKEKVVYNKNVTPKIVETEVLKPDFRQCQKKEVLTHQLETLLLHIIEHRQRAAPIPTILQLFREISKEKLHKEWKESLVYSDHHTQEIITKVISKTLYELNQSTLNNYIEKEKLTEQEAEAFSRSVRKILVDFSNGGCRYGYFEYLESQFDELQKQQQYEREYKQRFEYIAKKAKNLFSAIMKNGLNIK